MTRGSPPRSSEVWKARASPSTRAQVDAVSITGAANRIDVPSHNDEIARLAQTMRRRLNRLDDAAERQRRFVVDAAHEFREPLTQIRADVEIDLSQPESDDLRLGVDRGVAAETSLSHHSDGLLEMYRSPRAVLRIDASANTSADAFRHVAWGCFAVLPRSVHEVRPRTHR